MSRQGTKGNKNSFQRLVKLFLAITKALGVDYELAQSTSREKWPVISRQMYLVAANRLGLDDDKTMAATVINRDRCTAYAGVKTGNERLMRDPDFIAAWIKIIKNGGLTMDEIQTINAIKEVKWNSITHSLVVEFVDGSKYGETGKTACKTFKELTERDILISPLEKGRHEKVRD